MERYGGAAAMEGSSSDPVAAWNSPGGETGLEEPVWQLGLGSGPESYPERPDVPDCMYYLKTGFCGFGARCRFNHPRDRGLVVGGVEYPERVGQPVCQYYMRTGMCKFGASCKYHHPRQGGGSPIPVTLNISGYPLRPGEKECSYYMKTGQCKFGVTCKFHHPQPAGTQVSVPAPPAGPLPVPAPVPAPAIYPPMQSPSVTSSQQYGLLAGNWSVARPTLLPGSYIQGPYSPVLLHPGVLPLSSWSPYQASVSPVASPNTQSAVGGPPAYGITQLSPSAPAFMGAYLSLPSSTGPSSSNQKDYAFPERPGQPECQYYMKTGDCKFGPSCRYHHPPEWSSQKTSFALSPMGLPLRPGAALCAHYAQNGICKYGTSCKFDHSPIRALSYSPSASSLADMPVAPYPVGSSKGTLAPSSSSSELRPELISGSNRDALSTRMSSSVSTSSGSVGSIFSKNAAHASIQQSGQASTHSTAGSSTSQGGEVHPSS